MQRRKFIKTACAASTAGLCMWLSESCTPQKSILTIAATNNKLVISKSDFSFLKNNLTKYRPFVIVKTVSIAFPVVVYRTDDNKYTALQLKCTHQGCELTPYDTMMVCPCHGAEFDVNGAVITGPAENNLTTFTTTTDDNNIYIHL